MKASCLGPHFAIVETLDFSLALVLNITLVLLIVLKTPSELRTYSRVLVQLCRRHDVLYRFLPNRSSMNFFSESLAVR